MLALFCQRRCFLRAFVAGNVANNKDEEQYEKSAAYPKKYLLPVALLPSFFLVVLLLHLSVVPGLLVLFMSGLASERLLMLPFGARQAAIGMLLNLAEAFVFGVDPLIEVVVLVVFFLVFFFIFLFVVIAHDIAIVIR